MKLDDIPIDVIRYTHLYSMVFLISIIWEQIIDLLSRIWYWFWVCPKHFWNLLSNLLFLWTALHWQYTPSKTNLNPYPKNISSSALLSKIDCRTPHTHVSWILRSAFWRIDSCYFFVASYFLSIRIWWLFIDRIRGIHSSSRFRWVLCGQLTRSPAFLDANFQSYAWLPRSL